MTKTSFSTSWKSSTQPRKQRKYRYNAPLHVKQNLVHAHLSPELRKKYGTRAIQVRKGDKVKVLRGKFKKTEAKVERVDLQRERIFVAGVETIKKDGSKVPLAVNASNIMITEVDTSDKKRKQRLEGTKATAKPNVKPTDKKVTEEKSQ